MKDYSHLELDTHGCGLHCSSLSDPSQDLQFIVAGNECVYLYQPDERGPCFAFEGQKLIVHWYRGYLIIVSKDRKTSPKYGCVYFGLFCFCFFLIVSVFGFPSKKLPSALQVRVCWEWDAEFRQTSSEYLRLVQQIHCIQLNLWWCSRCLSRVGFFVCSDQRWEDPRTAGEGCPNQTRGMYCLLLLCFMSAGGIVLALQMKEVEGFRWMCYSVTSDLHNSPT